MVASQISHWLSVCSIACWGKQLKNVIALFLTHLLQGESTVDNEAGSVSMSWRHRALDLAFTISQIWATVWQAALASFCRGTSEVENQRHQIFIFHKLSSWNAAITYHIPIVILNDIIWLTKCNDSVSPRNFGKNSLTLPSQHCACWWPCTIRCQAICRHSDDSVDSMYVEDQH